MTTNLITQIAEALKSHDVQVLQSELDSVTERVAAMQFYKSNSPHRGSTDSRYYTGLFDSVGGKTWYNIIDGRNRSMINEYLIKRHNASIEARNAKIAKKFEKLEITEATKSAYEYATGRFFGRWVIETNQGSKMVEIESILAGGHNIQCLHNRVLTKVR